MTNQDLISISKQLVNEAMYSNDTIPEEARHQLENDTFEMLFEGFKVKQVADACLKMKYQPKKGMSFGLLENNRQTDHQKELDINNRE